MDETERKISEKELAQQAVDTILQDGVDFEITVRCRTLLHKMKLKPTSKTFKIYPLALGAGLKISKLLLEIDPEVFKRASESTLSLGIEQYAKIQPVMLECIALAIDNSDRPPPKRLIRFLSKNLTPKEMFRILLLVVNQLDINHFLAGLVSIRGVNLMETRQTGGELSEDSLNTSDSHEKKYYGDGVGRTS